VEQPEKEDDVRSVNLNDTGFNGRISRPFIPSEPVSSGCCLKCGSSLAKRRVSVTSTTTAAGRFVVELFRCRCGAGRRVKRGVS